MGILGRIKKRAGATGPKRGGLPSRGGPKRGGIGQVVKKAQRKLVKSRPKAQQQISAGKKPTKAPAIRRKPGRHLR